MVMHDPECRTIAVTAALARELSPLRPLAPGGVVFLQTGMGERHAERAIRSFLDMQKVRAVINTGFAGAVSASLGIGDIVISRTIRGRQGEIAASADLLSIAEDVSRNHTTVHFGTAVTIRDFATTPDKETIAESHGESQPVWVDMESFAIANVCAEHHIPCLAIRCITDVMYDEAPFDFNQFRTKGGGISYGRLIGTSIFRPKSIKTLMKYKERSDSCANRIASFLLQFLLHLHHSEVK